MSQLRLHMARRTGRGAGLTLALALFAAFVAPAVALASGTGHITGTVTASSAPGVGYYAAAFRAGSPGSWNCVGFTEVRSNGTYDIGGLASGTYEVEFGIPVNLDTRLQFYNHKHDFREATPVTVTSGKTTSGINGTFASGTGSVEGTVTSAEGPVAGIHVDVSGSDGAGNWDGGGSAVTSADGSFSITGLVEDAYKVHFSDPSGGYPSQTFSTSTGKDYIAVVPGAPVVASIVLKGAARITGTVTDGGTPMTYVGVNAYQSNGEGGWSWVKDAWTASDGTYYLTVPAPGTYRVDFTDQSRTCAYQVYPDAPDLDHGDDIVVAPGSRLTGIDGVLGAGGGITGVVTDGSASLDSVIVTVYRDAGSGDWTMTDDWYTKADGTYEVKGLGTGVYHVVFTDPSHLYWSHVFQDVDATSTSMPSFEEIGAGTDVTVTAGSVVPDVDATLALVTYPSNAPLASAVTIASDHGSTKLGSTFALSGLFTPGRRGDAIRVEVQKPGSARWSYSSARLAYATAPTGAAMWWYRYAPKLRGAYHFRSRVVADYGRAPAVSRIIAVVVK